MTTDSFTATDAHDTDVEPTPMLVQDLWLGALETLINSFIDLDRPTREALQAHQGLVIRVKTVEPYAVFYAHITPTGVELSSESLGVSRLRISGSLISVLSVLLGASPTPQRLQIWGESNEAAWMEQILRDFNLRTSAQRWLKTQLNVPALWAKIRGNDPTWISDLLPMPGLMKETLQELRSLKEQLAEQHRQHRAEMAAQMNRLRRQRWWDFGLLLLVLAGWSAIDGAGVGLTLPTAVPNSAQSAPAHPE